MSLKPKYPNAVAAIGTTIPVVTSLLAAISAALVAVPLTSTSTGLCARFAVITTQQAAIVFGSAAVVLFVGSTLATVYASACGTELADTATKKKGDLTDGATTCYGIGEFCWINGVCILALTLGFIAFEMVRWELPILACISAVAAALNARSNLTGSRRWITATVSIIVFLGCVYIAISSVGAHAYC